MGKKSENSFSLMAGTMFATSEESPDSASSSPSTPVLCQAHRIITSDDPGTILTWVIMLQNLAHCLLRCEIALECTHAYVPLLGLRLFPLWGQKLLTVSSDPGSLM